MEFKPQSKNVLAANDCVSNASDSEHWEFFARVMEKEVLGPNYS